MRIIHYLLSVVLVMGFAGLTGCEHSGHTNTDDNTDTNTDMNTDMNTDADTGTDTKTDLNTDADTGVAPDTVTDANTDTDTDSDTGTDTGVNTVVDTDADSDTVSETGSDSGTETGSDTGTETGSDSENEMDTATDTDTVTGSDAYTDSATDTETDTTEEYCDPTVDINGNNIADCQETLVVNSQFSSNIEGWTPFPELNIEHSPVDAKDNSKSGSLKTEITEPPGGSVSRSVMQCVPVNDTSHSIWVQYYIPPDQEGELSPGVTLHYFANPDCTEGIDIDQTSTTHTIFDTVEGSWGTFSLQNRMASPGAASVMLLLSNVKRSSFSPGIVHYDNVLLIEDTGICPGEDASIDINVDSIPDCHQNLLTNGQFTWFSFPWQTEDGVDTWATQGVGDKNSLKVTYRRDYGSEIEFAGATQCVPATEDETYSLYSEAYIAATSDKTGTSIGIQFFEDANCQDALDDGMYQTATTLEKDTWTMHLLTDLAPPARTLSAKVTLNTHVLATQSSISKVTFHANTLLTSQIHVSAD